MQDFVHQPLDPQGQGLWLRPFGLTAERSEGLGALGFNLGGLGFRVV